MNATMEKAQKLVMALATPDAIDKDAWKFSEEKGKIIAENEYRIIDRHGLYDSRRPFKLEWDKNSDLLAFSLKFEELGDDPALEGLKTYIETLIIDKMLDQHFVDTL